ncbi:cisplatin damage response ATP-dependent DNA ligase [Chelativorans sp. M5D2P16]|uniref:cisplatin damage response ATP-dependent DNA ligase n=1 Tax=Chelativorans sp. M5D2P16 TaxID=3095678 RepID=UPI002ACA79AB|nr:cisplatin damage response ATP-dependent DNA ligase [Chelativorans sp. M5D2P16]MDZ5697167.1 cisplatin damage response ATP-dependent DNA ligase [Chelativorans sp. M5D2P16]
MERFAELLDRLVLTPSRNGKLRLLTDYFASVPDPDRGYGLAALTGGLDFPAVKPAMLRTLTTERVDSVLFAYSYDYVGDLAETVSLIWPAGAEEEGVPRLSDVVDTLSRVSRSDAPAVMARLLDRLSPSGRFAAIKLATGGLRVGVSARLTKQALAELGGVDVQAIEELWHGLRPPFTDLFAWLEGKGEKPENAAKAPFRPVMLAHPAAEVDFSMLDPAAYAAEWKWDGIRVQAVSEGGVRRLYSRTGDDISGAFPDLVEAMDCEAALDGELLVGDPREKTGTFSDLQQRLNRKSVSRAMLQDYPVFMRCYDALIIDSRDTRTMTFEERRGLLEAFVANLPAARFDISPTVPFRTWEELDDKRCNPPHPVIEGVMLKRRDSAYLPGRPKGPWFKWKRDPFTVDAVLIYAQRGHGKRSSFYSDYTFGVWSGPQEDPVLVPVGKAYFGFTDEELRQIDRYVRENTVDRFGPVRAVRADRSHGLVVELAFEGIQRSTRHKSGIAMRFPRISRLRWDKPVHEADRIETLEAMLE